jgi:hypothetical protein
VDPVGHKSDWKPNVYGSKIMDRRSEPRAVTRDLDWELMFLWLEPKEKNYMFGLTFYRIYFRYQRMGRERR